MSYKFFVRTEKSTLSSNTSVLHQLLHCVSDYDLSLALAKHAFLRPFNISDNCSLPLESKFKPLNFK